jgi:hypothetical protein
MKVYMAVHATPPQRVLAGYDAYPEDSEHGYGLVLFCRNAAADARRATGTANFLTSSLTGTPGQYRQRATTTGSGVAADARPVSAADTTGHLALGTYDIADEAPRQRTGERMDVDLGRVQRCP